MEDSIFENIKFFVEKKRWKYDFQLLRTTQLEDDLQITGDDAIEFIIAFGKTFSVDVSTFNAAEYFEPEGDIILPAIIRFLKGDKKKQYEVLTLGDLEDAVISKKLDPSKSTK